jgi:hypothetical protein
MLEDEENVLSKIAPNDLVLDVGGWACPFNRADWVMDAEPYATRGFYEKIGLPRSQGGDKEHFTEKTWVRRDLCDREPWPFADKQFDFSICSHTLEDLRDPLSVCSELVRVSKAGYIEVPSRLWESCRGVEHPRMAGLSHHRWMVELQGDHLKFTQKYHCIHTEFDLSLPVNFARKLTKEQSIVRFYWKNSFSYSEAAIHGVEKIYAELRDYVRLYHTYPQPQYWWRWVMQIFGRGGRAFGRLRRSRSAGPGA